MRVRYLFFSVGLVSCLAVACTGDDEQTLPGHGGTAGSAGVAGRAGSNGAGTTNVGGEPGTGGGEPGLGGTGPGPGEGGGAGQAPEGFTAFVHKLVKQQTEDTNGPAPVNGRAFPDATDDHGHYLVPATDFDDLF